MTFENASPKDRSIIAAIVKFPDMTEREVDQLIIKLDSRENQRAVRAYVGRLSAESLSPEESAKLGSISQWALDTTMRTRQNEIKARQGGQQTQLAKKMIERHERGEISGETLMLFGMAGPLPERPTNNEDREKVRQQMLGRLEQRLGAYYWRNFDTLPSLFDGAPESGLFSWITEGF